VFFVAGAGCEPRSTARTVRVTPATSSHNCTPSRIWMCGYPSFGCQSMYASVNQGGLGRRSAQDRAVADLPTTACLVQSTVAWRAMAAAGVTLNTVRSWHSVADPEYVVRSDSKTSSTYLSTTGVRHRAAILGCRDAGSRDPQGFRALHRGHRPPSESRITRPCVGSD
jgi:hypothetical protein